MVSSYYYRQASELNRELKRAIPADRLKALHRKRPALHLALALRQLLLMIAMPLMIYHVSSPLVRVAAMVMQGVLVFSFTVLLHEVVHKAVFNRDPYNLNRWLGYVYGSFSGLAASQFKRWHLDHHDQLGTTDLDPKRAYLSPKINARWYKLLYCTPFLYPLYFRAAYIAAKAYPPELQKKIKRERIVAIGFHLGLLGAYAVLVSPGFALMAHAIPIFIVFPCAFTLNRLGQHYVINPDDVANWSTLMRPGKLWNFLFLYSSYHLEHHYFPAVPFYNLKALQRELDPFYQKRGIRAFTYGQLLKHWFVGNHVPHTDVKGATH